MIEQNRWSVVTVAYNSVEHFRRHWTDRPRDFDWVVVDNGSNDGSIEFAEEHADLLLHSGGNVGFAAANNVALEKIDTEYVVFVNPDVKIAGTWQATLEATIATTGGFVAPQLLNTDGTEQANARGLPFLAAKIRNRISPESPRGRDYARAGFDTTTYCAWVMGAAMAGRTEDFRAIGGWDDTFFLYYEDHEIGLRAWRSGYRVALEPAVRWTHDWQRATTELNAAAWKIELASMREFFRKHPEFLLGSARSSRRVNNARVKGFAEMCDRLWLPLGENRRAT